MLDGAAGGCFAVRLLARSAILTVALVILTPCGFAADSWGGSVGVTSDYFVRGISRSDNNPSVQADLHFLSDSGFVGGLFASSTRIEPGAPTDVELTGFVGFAWQADGDWHGRILASYYAYPWNEAGSEYNYEELSFDAGYQEWLDLNIVYSPNAPRYTPYRGLTGVTSKSAEMNLRTPQFHRLAATAGVGYDYYNGPDAAGYVYWSIGAALDLAPISISVGYVDTTGPAKMLFYSAAADGRWTATVIFRF